MFLSDNSAAASPRPPFHSVPATYTTLDEDDGGAVFAGVVDAYLTPHDGANARYVGVADEQTFSALHAGTPTGYAPLQHAGNATSPVVGPRDVSSTPMAYSFAASSAAGASVPFSQQLTPVRRSTLGCPMGNAHHRHHSTSYGHERYQRVLTNALLSGPDTGRPSSVLSFPMRTPTRSVRVSRRPTPDVSCTEGLEYRAAASPYRAYSCVTHPPGADTDLADALGVARLLDGAAKGSGCLWSPAATHTPRHHAQADETCSAAAAPLAYFQRAPPVWVPSSSQLTATAPRLPLMYDRDDSGSERDDACGAVVLGDAAAIEVDATASSFGAVWAATRPCGAGAVVEDGALTPTLGPHTPVVVRGGTGLAETFTNATFFTSPCSPYATAAVEEAGRRGGAATPLCLPSSTAHHVTLGTATTPPPPPPLSPPLPPAQSHQLLAPFPSVPARCADDTSSSASCCCCCATPPRSPALRSPLPARATPTVSGLLGSAAAAPWPGAARTGAIHSAALLSFGPARQLATPQCLQTPVRHGDASVRSTSAATIAGLSTSASAGAFMSSPSARRHAASPCLTTPVTPPLSAHHHRSAGASLHMQSRQRPCCDRETFQLTRALTAAAVSTDTRHRPLHWGCFGILVAQLTEVWCVGKTHPFRLFPPERELPPCPPRDAALEVTAVSTTDQLSLRRWESAAVSTSSSLPTDVAYVAVGTSAGDVFVQGYSRCPPTTPDATPVLLDAEEPHTLSTHTVRLERHGVLRHADRVGRGDCAEGGDAHHATLPRPEPAVVDKTVSALRVVDHWLYIGDQGGRVSRHDLRHAGFLRRVTEPSADVRLSEPSTQTAAGAAAAAVPLVVPPTGVSSCVPVHRFGRPPHLAGAVSAATVGHSRPPHTPHFAVDVGEPVFHVDVTDDHGYLAVGTQTRLLVYRTALLASVAGLPPSPLPQPLAPFASPCGDAAAPMVVVRDAAHPVQCFAWMRCDYDSLLHDSGERTGVGRQMPLSEADDDDGEDDHLVRSSPLPLTMDDELCGLAVVPQRVADGCCGGGVDGRHRPTPSLAFAVAWSRSEGMDESRMGTDVRVFRVVSHTTVASCTLDYPVRVLTVPRGTTQIIVATGGAAELTPLSPATATTSALPPRPASRPPHSPSTAFASRSASAAAAAAAAVTTSPIVGHRLPALVARRPSTAVAAAEAMLHPPHAARYTSRSTTVRDARLDLQRSPPPPPQQQQQQQRWQHASTAEERSGYMFLLDVCPADDGAMLSGAGDDYRVRLRVRGEVGVGEGESAVCGVMSPAQDHISVLVRPTEPHASRAAPAAVPHDRQHPKVKVWRIATAATPTPPCAAAAASASALASVGTISHSEVLPYMESLR
ncbi:hypothetical protein NESM_000200000 [Novymonas esmeraldas]|uniref:Uncharacterized protein n=1 Tax=Novymonas esmeraldas TaxID=1808958 RepID=A0AAW0F6D0_9TRYP